MTKSDLTSLAASMKALAESSKKQKEALEGISSSMKPIELMTGTLTKAVEMLIGSVVGATKNFDAMKIANADLNVNFFRMTDIIKTQGVDIGTITQHSQMQLDLHRIGYKKIDKDLRESLVWLEKTGGQGKDVLKFMTLMSEKGATLKTQEIIAKKITEVSKSTGQSARAAISAAQQMGDQMTVLAALGVDERILDGVLLAIKEMPEQNATSMGKFASQLLDPDDIGMAIHTGMFQAGNDLLNATSPEEIAASLNRSVESVAARAEGMLKMGAFDVHQLKLQRDTFVGPGGILAIQVRNAKRNLKASRGIGTGAEVFTNSTDAYKDSFLRVSESLEKAAEIVSLTFADKLLGPEGLISSVFRLANEFGEMLPTWRTLADSFIWIASHLGGAPLTSSESSIANTFGLFTRAGLDSIGGSHLDLGTKAARQMQSEFAQGMMKETPKGMSHEKYASLRKRQEDLYSVERSGGTGKAGLGGGKLDDMQADIKKMVALSWTLGMDEDGSGSENPIVNGVKRGLAEYAGNLQKILNTMQGQITDTNKDIAEIILRQTQQGFSPGG